LVWMVEGLSTSTFGMLPNMLASNSRSKLARFEFAVLQQRIQLRLPAHEERVTNCHRYTLRTARFRVA